MDATNPFWTYWYFHLPNYLLAALAYTMLARFGLSLVVPPDWPNYIWRFFLRLTDPFLAATATITPSFVPGALMPLVAVFWLLLLRMALWFGLRHLGLAPTVPV
jgi:uncharacterized protein YggT (Ycf19 family)